MAPAACVCAWRYGGGEGGGWLEGLFKKPLVQPDKCDLYSESADSHVSG